MKGKKVSKKKCDKQEALKRFTYEAYEHRIKAFEHDIANLTSLAQMQGNQIKQLECGHERISIPVNSEGEIFNATCDSCGKVIVGRCNRNPESIAKKIFKMFS